MKRVLFIDRDGTLIVEPLDEQIDSLEKLAFLPGVFHWLGRIARETDFELVIVTNQDGLGTETFPEETFWPAHQKMLDLFAAEGIRFADVHIDRSTAAAPAPTRKPGTAMLTAYRHPPYALADSWVIGDRATDVELARNLGCGAIRIAAEEDVMADATARDWEAIYRFLKGQARHATVNRETRETRIDVRLALDGRGESDIRTGLHFFDHMLDQVARHGMVDLTLHADGDLHVDEHHTIEDTALALGAAFTAALGSKRGIGRYGFILPMDDCLAEAAIDLGGRPWLQWDVAFRREKVGDFPTEMAMHFFKSFSDAAQCNLYLKATGDNDHHKVESLFKAFARALRVAVAQDDRFLLPTTKGRL